MNQLDAKACRPGPDPGTDAAELSADIVVVVSCPVSAAAGHAPEIHQALGLAAETAGRCKGASW
jgi:hypothetical protein